MPLIDWSFILPCVFVSFALFVSMTKDALAPMTPYINFLRGLSNSGNNPHFYLPLGLCEVCACGQIAFWSYPIFAGFDGIVFLFFHFIALFAFFFALYFTRKAFALLLLYIALAGLFEPNYTLFEHIVNTLTAVTSMHLLTRLYLYVK